jgi:5-methylcytosine-specific restriction endonuclease McrA
VSKAWGKGSTPEWRRIRADILLENLIRNEGRCTLAIPGVCTKEANQVHHTVSRAIVGDDRAYLVAVCRECNLKVGDPSKNSPQPKRVSNW